MTCAQKRLPSLRTRSALAFNATFTRRNLKRLSRHARFAIFLGIELREVASDNFVRTIAFDPLRADIPATHAAFFVEHANGVFGNALHEKSELRFASPEVFLSRFTFGQIARNFCKANDLA